MISALFASSAGGVDFGQIFTTLAIVLIVAKLAAEICERIGIPAVLGEIIAGIIIGPSALGLVEPSTALIILAEVGVIVLLAEVGLEMDLDELRRVGRSSFLVATIGVVVPMSSGIAAGSLLGETMNASLFLGAAMAATSVGITARVFGDLKALSSTEARIVLGAAVADDVMGLIILTVVTRVVEKGSIDIVGLASTIGLALGFLIVAGGLGIVILPKLVKWVGDRATSGATVGVVAAGITFAFSAAASGAKLAPIIGSFVAGAALGRTNHHDRIARDFAVVGSIFIPIFFMQIGIDTDVTKFFDGHVLLVAGILSVIAIVGKTVAAVGAFGTKTDKLVIGFGMIPRGEVGLIFATIGVSVGVFHEDLYAVVLLMVLVTTVISPPLLRWRIQKGAVTAANDGPTPDDVEPIGGWIRLIDGEVQLHGLPPTTQVLTLALEAAQHAAHAQPNDVLLDWMHNTRLAPLMWTEQSTDEFVELLMRGNARSWRFLEMTNVLDRALPELAETLTHRHGDTTELDPTHLAQTPVLEAMRRVGSRVTVAEKPLLLAALISDFSDGNDVSGILDRLVIDAAIKEQTRSLLSAAALLYATATVEPYEPNNRTLTQLAAFLGTPLMVEQCRLLTEARGNLQDWQFSVLMEITTSVQSLLAHPELIEGTEESIVEVRRRDAIALTTDTAVIERIRNASAAYVLAHEPDVLVRHARLAEPKPVAKTARVAVYSTPIEGQWEIDIAAADMRGLLSHICAVLSQQGFDIVNADLATWSDGAVVDTFVVAGESAPVANQLQSALEQQFKMRLKAPANTSVGSPLTFSLDNNAHPWHSVVTVTGVNRPGLIQALASAFAKTKIDVHHARITTTNGIVTDRFEVATHSGKKINDGLLQRVSSLFS